MMFHALESRPMKMEIHLLLFLRYQRWVVDLNLYLVMLEIFPMVLLDNTNVDDRMKLLFARKQSLEDIGSFIRNTHNLLNSLCVL